VGVAVDRVEGALVDGQVGGLAVRAERVVGQQRDQVGEVLEPGALDGVPLVSENDRVHEVILADRACPRRGAPWLRKSSERLSAVRRLKAPLGRTPDKLTERSPHVQIRNALARCFSRGLQ